MISQQLIPIALQTRLISDKLIERMLINQRLIKYMYPVTDNELHGEAHPSYREDLPYQDILVDTNKIVAIPFKEQLYGSQRSKILSYIKAIRSGKLLLEHVRPELCYYGGLFVVQDGRKRITAAKALGYQRLPVRVFYTEPGALYPENETAYQRFLHMIDNGLFTAQSIEKPWVRGVFGAYAKIEIKTHIHTSIFCIGYEKQIENLYNSRGASGKSAIEEFLNM